MGKKRNRLAPMSYKPADTQPQVITTPVDPRSLPPVGSILKGHLTEARMVPVALSAISGINKLEVHDTAVRAAWQVEYSEHRMEIWNGEKARLGNVMTLYHGTKTRNIKAIVDNGLKCGSRNCAFQSAIYLGMPDKAFHYAENEEGVLYLLEVRAILGRLLTLGAQHIKDTVHGRVYDTDKIKTEMQAHDSLTAMFNHREWVVYDPSHVMINRVFELMVEKTVVKVIPPRVVKAECGCLKPVLAELGKYHGSSPGFGKLYKPCGVLGTTVLSVRCGGKAYKVTVCDKCLTGLRVGDTIRIKSGVRGKSYYNSCGDSGQNIEAKILGIANGGK